MLYKAFSKPHYNTKIVLIPTNYTSTILRWSVQSILHIVLDLTCNDPILQTSNIMNQHPEVFEHDSTKDATHVSHKTLWNPFSTECEIFLWPYDKP